MGIPDARLALGREVRRAIADSGQTAQELADRLEVSRQAIYRWMGGDVPIDRLDALAEATGQQLVIRIGQEDKAAWPEWARALDAKVDALAARLGADPLGDALYEARGTTAPLTPDEDPPRASSNRGGGR